MAPLEWSEKYRLGIPELDEQHELLFSGVNAIIQAVLSDQEEAPLGDLFTRLMDDTRTHFKTEERLMERAGYPGLDGHRTIHHHLFDDVTRMMFRATAQREALHREVIPLLRTWLVDHILNEDLDLARHVRRMDAVENPSEAPQGLFEVFLEVPLLGGRGLWARWEVHAGSTAPC